MSYENAILNTSDFGLLTVAGVSNIIPCLGEKITVSNRRGWNLDDPAVLNLETGGVAIRELLRGHTLAMSNFKMDFLLFRV